MKIPLSMITAAIMNHLQERDTVSPVSSDPLISRPVFFRAGKSYSENDLVLAEAPADAPEIADLINGKGIVFCRAPISGKGVREHVFFVEPQIPFAELSNRIHEQFDLVSEWESQLQECVIRNSPLDRILDLTENLIGNPLDVMGMDFIIVGASHGLESSVKRYGYELSKGPLSRDLVNIYKTDADFSAVSARRDPFFYPANAIRPMDVLCINLFLGENMSGRIILFESNHKLQPSDSFVLQRLAYYVEQVFVAKAIIPKTLNDLSEVLLNAVTGKNLPPDVKDVLSHHGWSVRHEYIIVVLQTSRLDYINRTQEYFRIEIMRSFPECVSICLQDQIVVWQNISLYPGGLDSFQQDLSLFIRDGFFHAGFSSVFYGPERLVHHYRQGLIALEFGSKVDSTFWTFHFKQYAFDYLIDTLRQEMPREVLLAPELDILEEYDAQHNTELLKTLKLYIENAQNATKTAQDLYIQRGTLLFRIGRIRKIASIDFSDSKKLLHIWLSFYLRSKT